MFQGEFVAPVPRVGKATYIKLYKNYIKTI